MPMRKAALAQALGIASVGDEERKKQKQIEEEQKAREEAQEKRAAEKEREEERKREAVREAARQRKRQQQSAEDYAKIGRIQLPETTIRQAEAGTKAQKAKKELEAYLASDEYKAQSAALASNEAEYYAAQKGKGPKTDKEKRLRAVAGHYEAQENAAKDEATLQRDMDEINAMTDSERGMLAAYITEREREKFNFLGEPSFQSARYNATDLFNKYGAKRVQELAESYSRWQNRNTAKETAKTAAEGAGKGVGGAIGHSAASVGANLVGAMTAPLGYLGEAMDSTGRYTTMDSNNLGNLPNVYSGAVRSQVAEDIAGDEGKTGRKILSYGYQGVMGAADSIARILATGGTGAASLGLAAMGSFGQTMSEASAQGATPAQAAMLATATAGIEVITEKLPLDELLKTAKGGAKPAMKAIGTVLKQAGIEATTEEISLLGSLAAEAAILRDKSTYSRRIGDMISGGMSYEEAKAEAAKGLWEDVKQTAWVSAISGGMSSGAATGTAYIDYLLQGFNFKNEAAVPTESETAAAELADLAIGTAEGVYAIREDMPEAERYEVLKNRKVNIVSDDGSADHAAEISSLAALKAKAKGKAEKIIKPLARKLGILNRTMTTPDVEMEFLFSNGGLNESIHKQLRYGGDYADFAKTMINLDKVLQNAVLVEKHGDKYAGTSRASRNLENVYVLFGAFRDGSNVIPVQMEIKKTSDAGSRLYMTVAMTKIEADVPGKAIDPGRAPSLISASKYNIADIFGKINPKDAHFLKYLPDNFLSDEQRQAKQIALAEDAARIEKYREKNKTGSIATPESVQADSFTPKATGGTAPSEDVTQAPAEGPSANHETNARSALASPSPDYRVTEDSEKVNENTGLRNEGGSDYGGNTVGSAESRFRHEIRRSKTYDNTYANATDEEIRAVGAESESMDPHVAEYEYISEKESLHNATQRVGSYSAEEVQAEFDDLVKKQAWTGEDNDTAMLLLKHLMKNGERDKFRVLAKAQKERGTTGGQFIQSFAKYTRTAEDAAADAINTLDSYTAGDVESRFYRKHEGKNRKGRFEAWRDEIMESVLEIGSEIDGITEGDAQSMRDIVRQLANFRRTTAWAGNTNKLTRAADRIVKKLDYATAKDIAIAQLSMIPDDFRRRAAGEQVKTIRIQNMLSALTTVGRNLAGNATTGMMDAVSDSTGGRMMDMLMSKFTGKRTVTGDVRYAKEYFTAAKDAADMASLCVELDIPMETDAAYSTGKTRNYSPNSGLVTRFFSAYEKYLKYSLEVTDKFFEGGTAGAVSKGLEKLGAKSGLTQAEISRLSQKAGERRTFKEGRNLAKANTKLKEGLNMIGTKNIGVGDFLIPFAGVPGDVAQVGVDYSGMGMIEGLFEIISVIKDARAGKEIDVYRQRKAATDFGRGMTGAGLVAMFTALAACGIVGVHDEPDRDKNSLEQSLGLSGAQFNVDAAARAIKGESTEWREDDLLVSIDFLEPYNSLMYIGYLMSQEDNIKDMVKAYPGNAFRGVLSSILDMPMMQTFSDVADIVSSLTEVTEDGDFSAVQDAVGQMAGNTMTGFIPSWMRQTAQYIDPYYRDTTGKNPIEKAANQFMAAVPFASRRLPEKYDGLGNVQMRYENPVEGFFDTFISPTDATRIKGSEIADFLDDLSERTGDMAVYPDYQPPKSFKVKGETVTVEGEDRAIYQKTYGDNITALYGALMESGDFDLLSEKQQAEALRKAKEYATQFAKAAVSDYDEVQTGIPKDIAGRIVQNQVTGAISDAFEQMVENWDDGADAAGATLDLEAAGKLFDSMSNQAKAEIRADAGGRLEYFLTARSKGIKTETFTGLYKAFRDIDQRFGNDTTAKAKQWAYELQTAAERGRISESQKAALKNSMVYMQMFAAETEKFDQMTGEAGLSAKKALDIGKLLDDIIGTGTYNPDTKKNEVRDIDKWEKLSETSLLTDSERDAVIKLYMPDYDPKAADPIKTELKYDYARQEMGISAEDYMDAYRANLDNSKKDDKIAAFRALGYSAATAERLYYLFCGSGKKKIDVVAWYEGK